MSHHNSYAVDVFLEDNDIYEEVNSVIAQVWSNFSSVIQSKWLAMIEVPIAAEIAIAKVGYVVAWATLQHDGEVVPSTALETRYPEKEPVPVMIDPWARGAGISLSIKIN